jgi:hypothetical protein
MRSRLSIIGPLLAVSALAAGCAAGGVVKVSASPIDAACKRVYFSSTIKQGDSYTEGVPALVEVAAGSGVIPIDTSPQIDLSQPVAITLRVDRSDAGCARFPKGSVYRYQGALSLASGQGGQSVYGVPIDQFSGP